MGLEQQADKWEQDFKNCHYILLLEDDEGVRALGKQILEGGGYRVIAASHIPEALNAILEQEELGQTPSSVVTDLNFKPFIPPDKPLDGLKFKKIFSRLHPDVEVLLATSSTDADPRVKEYRGSGESVIGKPFDLDEFCNWVARSEERFRRRREVPLG
jgi:DNA-binding NtrC family response regulator